MLQKNGKTRLLHNRRDCCYFSLRGSGLFVNLGQSALHITAAEATGAHVHATGGTIHHDTDTLHIGRPDAMALTIGMADVVPVQRTLFANLTILTHGNPPPHWRLLHIKPI